MVGHTRTFGVDGVVKGAGVLVEDAVQAEEVDGGRADGLGAVHLHHVCHVCTRACACAVKGHGVARAVM